MNTSPEYNTEEPRMDYRTIQEMNTRLLFQSGSRKRDAAVRPWQYIQMEYSYMGIIPPADIPPLASIEDAEIWMCLDERVNRSLRMRENSIAG